MSTVKLAIIEELKERIYISLEYRKQINEAKTAFKKSFYMKKLIKNNKFASNLLIALDRLNQSQKNNELSIPERGITAPGESLFPVAEEPPTVIT